MSYPGVKLVGAYACKTNIILLSMWKEVRCIASANLGENTCLELVPGT